MSRDTTQAQEYAQKWLELIQKPRLTQTEAEMVSEESVYNFTHYFNRGFIDYRKSVTVAGGFAAAEWSGCGAMVEDVFGSQWLDCLGGYGLLSLDWSHPKVV